MACTFYREIPSFDLRFACNFKGCLDDRPMSMMGAIEHQAFHFCEVYKTQAHFNFKCEYCNVYHVNKSHHRLCLEDKSGIGHLPYLRSIYTVPMSDPEFHSCVDFSRFANHHMIAVTADGVRLVPADRVPSLPALPVAPYNMDSSLLGNGIDGSSTSDRKNSSVSYRDLDNFDENSSTDKFGRSGGFQDRGQSGNREFRGRGRGGFRGRGERGFGRGRGRGGGNRDDDNGRENSYRGRGRGRGGDRSDGNSSYRSRDSFGDSNASGFESKPKREHSYSRSGSRSPCSPVTKKANFGNNTRTRSYSRSRSGSPLPQAAKKTGDNRSNHVSRPCSYSRSRSGSPLDAAAGKRNVNGDAIKVSDQDRKPPNRNAKKSCSYSRSRSSSPMNSAGKEPSTESRQGVRCKPRSYSRSRSSSPTRTASKRTSTVNDSISRRSDRSYSRSGSRSPPRAAPTINTTGNPSTRSRSRSGDRSPSRNEVNNNNPEAPQENNTMRNVYNTEPENYMNSGYGTSRQSVRDRNRNTFNRSATESNHSASGPESYARDPSAKKYATISDIHQPRNSRGLKRGAEVRRRDCSYTKSRSSSP